MILYLFKDRNGKIEAMNERGANNEIRNKGTWQKQDLVYIGAGDDSNVKGRLAELNALSLVKITNKDEKIIKLLQERRLAELENDPITVEKKDIEIEMQRNSLTSQMKEFFSSSPAIDTIKAEYLIEQQANLSVAYSEIIPDNKILPRNLNVVTSNFGGDNSTLSPVNFITPKD